MIRAIKEFLPLMMVLSAISWVTGYSGVCSGSHPRREPAPTPEPAVGSEASQHGRTLFLQSCAHCHGDDAHGNGSDEDGPDLYRLRVSNARIAAVIRKGIPEEMPSFGKKHSAQDIADLTAYLRTLQ